MSFPYDFGFSPHTIAPDGDPIDITVLLDEPAFTDCLMDVRIIGMIEAVEKAKNHKSFNENNRILTVAEHARLYHSISDITDLDAELLNELEHFFIYYSEVEEKVFKPKDRKKSSEAINYIKKYIR
jgi:inorganic pyrophosphatase